MAPGIVADVRIQSVNALTAGFSFAAAIAWLDFIRWAISNLVRLKPNGGSYFFMSALLTTLISVLAVTFILRFGGNGVTAPAKPVYAVTR